MARPVARAGDATSHGGMILTGSSGQSAVGTGADAAPVARIGDLVSCPLPGHGLNPIVGGSDAAGAHQQPVARLGDLTACGAVLIGGGRPSAS